MIGGMDNERDKAKRLLSQIQDGPVKRRHNDRTTRTLLDTIVSEIPNNRTFNCDDLCRWVREADPARTFRKATITTNINRLVDEGVLKRVAAENGNQAKPWWRAQFSLRMFLIVSVVISVLGGMLGPPLTSYIRLLSSQAKSSPQPKATPTWAGTNDPVQRGSIGYSLTEAIQAGLIERKPISGSNK